ncbi:hypothetical protein Q9R34_21475 [Enterobacter sp. BRE11]|nr:hypothetical protein [Enterobacter sp. BRE11]
MRPTLTFTRLTKRKNKKIFAAVPFFHGQKKITHEPEAFLSKFIDTCCAEAGLMRSRLRKRARIYHFSSFYYHTDVNLQPIVLSKDLVTCRYGAHIPTGFFTCMI